MTPQIQFLITLIVGIVTFFAGQFYERRKTAQANRLKLIEPIEEWAKMVDRVIAITSVSAGVGAGEHPEDTVSPQIYSMNDRIEIAKFIAENRLKILGTLKSQALNMRNTKALCERVSQLFMEVSQIVEMEIIGVDNQLWTKLRLKQDVGAEAETLKNLVFAVNIKMVEIHACLAHLKVRLV